MNVYYNFKHLIDEPNKNAILSMEIKCIKNRLLREYTDLYKIYPNSIIFIYYNEKLKNINFSIRIDEKNIINNYTFIIDKKYPFYPPKILFNNKPYSNLLKLPSQRFMIILQKLLNNNCLCCKSLDCKFNWSPAITLNTIINDISKNRRIKRTIVIYILQTQIKNKYLIDDIDLFSFIF
jgi:ubiquitin-protein ligase